MLEVAKEEVARQNALRVEAIYIKLGQLSGVVKEALLFSYNIACEGTIFQGSRLVIEELPVIVYCSVCQKERTLVSIQSFSCPICNTLTFDVKQGRELEIVALEIQT